MVSYSKMFGMITITLWVVLVTYMNSNENILSATSGSNLQRSLPAIKAWTYPSSKINQVNFEQINQHSSILSHLLTGHWKTRPLTKSEDEEISKFLSDANARYRFPTNYQRTDGLCGNVTHIKSKSASWIRALCDPKGPTPCCFNNKCAMKSVEECVCPDCYDMRNLKHAEYSTWIPSDTRYVYKEHSPEEACRILKGSTILFAGDSLVRHVYTAMLLIITGNMQHGAMKDNVPQDIRNMCSGMYMFTEKVCRLHLKFELSACNGTVNLEVQYFSFTYFGPKLKKRVETLNNKSLLFTGLGIHSQYNNKLIQENYLLPILNYIHNKTRHWPKVIWAATHAPGIMKSPKALSQSYDSVKRFNNNMGPFLRSCKVPDFNTFNMTDGMASFDGEHYGLGMNVAKANLLLSYLHELKTIGLW